MQHHLSEIIRAVDQGNEIQALTTEGTGLVHISPGFGIDDHAIVKREGLDIYGQAFVNRSWNQLRPVDFDVWQATSSAFHEFTVARAPEKMAALARNPDFRARAVREYDPIPWAGAGGPLDMQAQAGVADLQGGIVRHGV